MENINEMKINKLPAKTWYWLRMNDTALNWNPDMACEDRWRKEN